MELNEMAQLILLLYNADGKNLPINQRLDLTDIFGNKSYFNESFDVNLTFSD